MANETRAKDAPPGDGRADAFVRARSSATALFSYPGEAPATLEEAYRVQDAAISLWPDRVVGWKVGRITGKWEDQLGTDRLAGPIFNQRTVRSPDGSVAMEGFSEGFIAVEAECVIILASDAPADKMKWSTEEARELVGAVHLGVEIASSPYVGINEDGPLATISDFGNNHGLIIGDELSNGANFPLDDWTTQTLIDGALVGENTPAGIPGGPLESLRFLLENTAQRGRPLSKGDAISTGAITGVHQAGVGQSATVRMNGVSDIHLEIIAARPLD